jgi:hypothetical protein
VTPLATGQVPIVRTMDVPRPEAADVVDLILDDHRLLESLLREMRDVTGRCRPGATWSKRRNALFGQECGGINSIRSIVAKVHADGALPAEEEADG